MSDDIERTITWNLDSIELGELIMVVGSYIFSGSTMDDVDIEVLEKLSHLSQLEYARRLTEVPKNEIIH
jgi:hypothetical protein|tara:strand:+ start:6790 stop:6996 length:207 start_codon:yes stop_codon:yes gene_type:complete